MKEFFDPVLYSFYRRSNAGSLREDQMVNSDSLIARIIPDPHEPVFNRIDPIPSRMTGKYKRASVFDSNNRELTSNEVADLKDTVIVPPCEEKVPEIVYKAGRFIVRIKSEIDMAGKLYESKQFDWDASDQV